MKRIEIAVREVFAKRLLFTPHSVGQMEKPERLITLSEVKEVIQSGRVIEDYPEDKRGHSCLMMGFTSERRPLHVVCSPKDDYLAVITVYVPDPSSWNETFTLRKR